MHSKQDDCVILEPDMLRVVLALFSSFVDLEGGRSDRTEIFATGRAPKLT
jgi:hypothetical protein